MSRMQLEYLYCDLVFIHTQLELQLEKHGGGMRPEEMIYTKTKQKMREREREGKRERDNRNQTIIE